MTIGILDIGIGNIYSVITSINKISNCNIILINNYKLFKYCDKIIFPGQGNCYNLKKNIKNNEIFYYLKKNIFNGKHFMGICLGSQIIFNFNKEANINGIGYFNNKINKLKNCGNVPCIGWCQTEIIKKNFLLEGIKKKSFFYHSHSYYNKISKHSLGMVYYINFFSSIYFKKNILLTQFHPEKSGINGLKIIKNFINWK